MSADVSSLILRISSMSIFVLHSFDCPEADNAMVNKIMVGILKLICRRQRLVCLCIIGFPKNCQLMKKVN
jgi:hypothetical protein